MSEFTYSMIPKGGDENSPHLSYLTQYYRDMGKWLDSAYEEASGLQKEVPEVKAIQDQLDYLVGLQWKQDLPSYRAKPITNEALWNFIETIGLLTDLKPTFNIKEIGFEGEFSQDEKILNALARGWAKTTNFNRRMAFWVMMAMLTDAPIKLYWNPLARGDDPSDYYNGDVTMEVLKTRELMRLGVGFDYQEDEMLIYRKVRTLNWIKRRYPKMGQLVRPDTSRSRFSVDVQAPPIFAPELFQQLSPQAKRLVGGGDTSSAWSAYPKAEVVEYHMKDDTENESSNPIWMGPEGSSWGYWVKPGQRLYPRGRLIVRANGVTLWDEPNAMFHRKKPFVKMALYDVPFQDYAMSVISPWVKGNDILNQIMAGVLDCVKKAVRPALMAPKSAIHPNALRQIDASKPNLKISYNSNAATPPSWQNPPNVPSYVFSAYETVNKSLRRGSGASAMDEAGSKKQVPGADTLDRITFARTTNVRLMSGNVENSVDEMGELWVGTALQCYDTAHRVELLGIGGVSKQDLVERVGQMIPDGTSPESFIRKYKFECERGTLFNFQKQDRVQVGFALRKNKDLSRPGLYRMLDWNINLKQIEAELQEEMEAQAKAMAAAGIQPGQHKGHAK